MNKSKNNYRHLSQFVLRTPLLPIDFYHDLTKEKEIPSEYLKQCFNKPIIKEAIYLASPSLFRELDKWVNMKRIDESRLKIKFALIKYLIRLSTRCTPFGLFAGNCLGKFSDKTEISLGAENEISRYTRLDMNYLVNLSTKLSKSRIISDQLKFYPNSSVYTIGDKFRYIEYYYINETRKHDIVEVDKTEFLDDILEKAKHGVKKRELVQILIDKGVPEDVAISYVLELIANQVLVSEFEPTISGKPFVEHLMDRIKGNSDIKEVSNRMEFVIRRIKDLDNDKTNKVKDYIAIENEIKDFNVEYNPQFLLQTDLEKKFSACTISKDNIPNLDSLISLFNKITPKLENESLNEFKREFLKRFETREIPLSLVMDTEIGIGYPLNQSSGDKSPLVDDLILPVPVKILNSYDITWNKLNSIILSKILDAKGEHKFNITLSDEDFDSFEEDWTDLPDTISTIAQLVEVDGREKFIINGFGGSSAANLLARFGHSESNLTDFITKITALEQQLNPEHIIAEIIHLPESRVGNILIRPAIRSYEIPYLARSNMQSDNQIFVEDIMVSVRNNRIILRSRKHDKLILPRLTNAHNYTRRSLPVYHFLCDMQSQGLRKQIGFSYGPLESEFEFLPRVEYKDIIIRPAQWNLKRKALENIFRSIDEEYDIQRAIDHVKVLYNLPDLIFFSQGDNELLINLNNHTTVKLFLDASKNLELIILKEFIGKFSSPVSSLEGTYTNQVVIGYYNDSKK